MMGGPMAAIGIGANIAGGIFGAMGAKNKAKGDALNIQGQMLQTMGQAYQLDMQAAEYGTRANMSDYQAGVAKINRDIALQQADYALAVGDVEAQKKGMEWRSAIASAKAYQASSGLNVNTGSAVDVRASMVELGTYDQTVIRSNAAKVAWGYDIEATQNEAQSALYTMQAGIERMQATAATEGAKITRQGLGIQKQALGVAQEAGTIGVMSSLVGAAGSVASKWTQGTSVGLFPNA